MGRRPDPLGGDCSSGPWQRTEAGGKGGPTHPDDTLGGALQMGRTGIPWLLNNCDDEATSIPPLYRYSQNPKMDENSQ